MTGCFIRLLLHSYLAKIIQNGHAELVEASLPLRLSRCNEAVEMLRQAQHDRFANSNSFLVMRLVIVCLSGYYRQERHAELAEASHLLRLSRCNETGEMLRLRSA